MSSCDIQTKNKVMSVLNKPEHQKTISKINDLVNQIPCDIRQNGGGMTNAQYVQLLSLVTAIIIAINAVMEVKEIQSAQCDLSTMVLNALAKSQYCTTQSNALNSAITTAVAQVTGAAGVGVTSYLLAKDEENKETKGGRRVRKARKSRKSRKTKKSKKSRKVKKSKKARKSRKTRKSRKA